MVLNIIPSWNDLNYINNMKWKTEGISVSWETEKILSKSYGACDWFCLGQSG